MFHDRTTPKLLRRLSLTEQSLLYCQYVLVPATKRGMDTSDAMPWSHVLRDRGELASLEYLAGQINTRLSAGWQLTPEGKATFIEIAIGLGVVIALVVGVMMVG